MPNHITSFLNYFIFLILSLPSSYLVAKKVTAEDKIQNTLIIYLENHSFYNLFAHFPGADNQPPNDYHGQIDKEGLIYKELPPVTQQNSTKADLRFSKKLTNEPFLIDQFVKLDELIPDPSHEFFIHQIQINDGRNDKFVLYSGVGALAMGYYNMENSYFWKLAKEYVLSDQFYQSAYGGSFLNHQWLIAAQTPYYANAPEKLKIKLNKDGIPEKVKPLTEDNFVVNTIQPQNPPFAGDGSEIENRLPPLEIPTIGDRLSDKKITWAWYAGGWDAILKGENPANFQFHHQPFLYYKNFAPGTTERLMHLKDEDKLFEDIKSNRLPKVSFYKPVGSENAHPGYTDIASSINKVQKLIELLKKSKQWPKTLVIITFDEHGGFWDPKAPQKLDRWGLGTRIPTLFVSPQVKKSFVDHTQYETVSILSFLEKKYSLPPLSDRDKNANPLTGIWAH